MTEEEYQKKVKWTKIFCFIIGIPLIIGILGALNQQNYLTVALALLYIVLLYLFYSLTKKKNIAGPIIGIVLGIIYILQLDLIIIIMGIFIIIDCISMIKYIKQK